MNAILPKGLFIGLIATLASTLLEILGYIFFNIATTIHMLARLIFPSQDLNLLKLFYGLVVHLTAGGILGVSMVLLFRYLKYVFPYILAVTAGLVFWIIHTLILPHMVSSNVMLFRSEIEVTIDLISHMLYGFIVMFYLNKNLGKNSQS